MRVVDILVVIISLGRECGESGDAYPGLPYSAPHARSIAITNARVTVVRVGVGAPLDKRGHEVQNLEAIAGGLPNRLRASLA
jgi:hypothetical protein